MMVVVAGEHLTGRAWSRKGVRPRTGVRLFQEEATRERRNARVHGARGARQRCRLRLLRRLVLLRLHAVQIAQGPQSLSAAQDQRQERDRQDDAHAGINMLHDITMCSLLSIRRHPIGRSNAAKRDMLTVVLNN